MPILGGGSDDTPNVATEADMMVGFVRFLLALSAKYLFQTLRVAELKTWVSDHRIVSSGTKKNGKLIEILIGL
jgi:hypothetical protein